MTAMVNGYPTEEELCNRITRQLSWHREKDTVVLIWRGYLAGLLEWGVIEFHVYERLVKLLPQVGNKELSELFADEPLSAEQEREIDDFLRQCENPKS
ncbi:hypothetical protein BCF11_2536 [Collimonas sp. PA-H2]|uniref:hypothetical protein n=1 Tax=Collimonas sp. PA-H2 TaxID=1881062 RepID=UPI000C00CD69|nr:hypothetical protein [Collimonas sp. PA-H2]PFH10125.1 hypothetical protein BCF11_2536 [Collimonas sp. PA-H2]